MALSQFRPQVRLPPISLFNIVTPSHADRRPRFRFFSLVVTAISHTTNHQRNVFVVVNVQLTQGAKRLKAGKQKARNEPAKIAAIPAELKLCRRFGI